MVDGRRVFFFFFFFFFFVCVENPKVLSLLLLLVVGALSWSHIFRPPPSFPVHGQRFPYFSFNLIPSNYVRNVRNKIECFMWYMQECL